MAVQAGSGPVRDMLEETSPNEGSRNQSPGRLDTRMGEVEKRIKDLMSERNWNQRVRRTGRDVAEDGRISGVDGDYTERGVREKRSSLKAGVLQGGELRKI